MKDKITAWVIVIDYLVFGMLMTNWLFPFHPLIGTAFCLIYLGIPLKWMLE